MKKTKKALALLLSIVLILSLGSMSVFAAAYDFQGTGGQTLKMLTPSDITVKSADTDAYYKNVINTAFDPAADIIFNFTMGSGMNNFSEATFKSANLPLITVSSSYGGAVVATPAYVSGSAAGVTISVGKLAEGTYDLVFGKGIQANNASKILGKDIVFEFTVKKAAAPAPASPFTDVPEWAEDYVAAVVANGCMQGSSATTFGPDVLVTRGEFITILGKARGIKTANYTTSAFTDVKATDTVSPYAAWAAEKKIVLGKEDGSFGANDKLTKEQSATILYRYAVAFALDTAASGNTSTFTDGAQVSSWAATAMAWAIGHNYVGGTGGGLLVPAADVTKAQVAKLITVMILTK